MRAPLFLLFGAGLGLAAGILSGLLGLGGGVVMVPAMVLFMGLSQHLAQGTSLAVIIPTAAVGAGAHFRHGRVNLRAAAVIGLGGLLGAYLGSSAALHVDGDILRRAFGVFMVLVAVRMIR
ncbi:MAG: TSUP family transporter [Candidatus Dormibacteria bacterium]